MSNSKAWDQTHLFIHHFQPITWGHFRCKSSPLAPRSLANTFLHAWCLRSDWDDRCVNIWKIACRNLHKNAWFADKKCILPSNQFSFLPMQSFPVPRFLSVTFCRKNPLIIAVWQPFFKLSHIYHCTGALYWQLDGRWQPDLTHSVSCTTAVLLLTF